jgi:hypothetical protein
MEIKAKSNINMMLRTTCQYHAHLIAAADTKASIVITMCSIIAAFSIGQTGSPHLKWGFIMLSLSSVLSLVLAVISVMPRIRTGQKSKSGLRAPTSNILFFGHFLTMGYDAFEKRLEEIFLDDREVYRAQLKDVYAMGAVLDRKYQFLKMSYLCFVSGFVISILLVAFSYIFV